MLRDHVHEGMGGSSVPKAITFLLIGHAACVPWLYCGEILGQLTDSFKCLGRYVCVNPSFVALNLARGHLQPYNAPCLPSPCIVAACITL